MSHPPWHGTRVPLRLARQDGGRVAGRYLHGPTRDLLEDATAVVEIEAPSSGRPAHGDQVAGSLVRTDAVASVERFCLEDVEILATARRELPAEIRRAAAQRPALSKRAAIISAIRGVLDRRGFLEVETPSRVINPGLEVHLRPFESRGADGEQRWLVTSPELHLKRLLAAGYEQFYELARVFRDEERGRHHVSEFLLLEWYRSHAGLPELASDIAEILPVCARAAGLERSTSSPGCDFDAAPVTVSYRDAFLEHARRDPESMPVPEREQVFAAMVEPHLGRQAPLLLVDWPADACALARLRTDATGLSVAARMELFVDGVELANGFDELNDPDEQRRRHEADRSARRELGTAVPPLDEGFLEALESAAPPAAGMALGVDRLVMLLLGQPNVADVRLFPT